MLYKKISSDKFRSPTIITSVWTIHKSHVIKPQQTRTLMQPLTYFWVSVVNCNMTVGPGGVCVWASTDMWTWVQWPRFDAPSHRAVVRQKLCIARGDKNTIINTFFGCIRYSLWFVRTYRVKFAEKNVFSWLCRLITSQQHWSFDAQTVLRRLHNVPELDSSRQTKLFRQISPCCFYPPDRHATRLLSYRVTTLVFLFWERGGGAMWGGRVKGIIIHRIRFYMGGGIVGRMNYIVHLSLIIYYIMLEYKNNYE